MSTGDYKDCVPINVYMTRSHTVKFYQWVFVPEVHLDFNQLHSAVVSFLFQFGV